MSTIATFIGIDRHAAAPDVRDLAGARRDAVRVAVLVHRFGFRTSGPPYCATKMRRSRPCARHRRHAWGMRKPTDTVVFSFSGHGTPDHRMVLHDTRREALHDTTIPMTEIADAFRTSKAGAIICIIDCCFSGGAPARVLDDAPVPRDPGDPYAQIVGTGRVLIARLAHQRSSLRASNGASWPSDKSDH